MGSSHTILLERTYDYLLYTKDVTAFYDEGNIWDETKIHTYSMYKEGDEEHYGAMLMGMESDAHGVMNQMGHTHDIHATPEKASSFGGQRTDGMSGADAEEAMRLLAGESLHVWNWTRMSELLGMDA